MNRGGGSLNAMIKVSVIVPIFNAEAFLITCLESLSRQSLQEIEIICVEDCSSDRSLDIIQGYQKKDSRLRIIINKENIGAAESRNIGLQAARGEYIQFMDADDYLELNALESLYVEAQNHNVDMCYLGMQLVLDNLSEQCVVQKGIQGSYPEVYSGVELLRLLIERDEFFLYLCSVFYKTSFIKEKKLYFKNLVIGEGGDFILRALCQADRVIVCRNEYYHYRIHDSSTTHRENARKELLFGQIVQYIDVLQIFAQQQKEEVLAVFLQKQYKKMAGGILNLTETDKQQISNRLQIPFSKHIFNMLGQENNKYGIVFQKETILRVQKKKTVIIYGAGYASREIVDLLQQYAVEIIGFAVTKRDREQTCMYGHHVYEIRELVSHNKHSIVLVAANKKYNHEIGKILENYGFYDYIFLNVEI